MKKIKYLIKVLKEASEKMNKGKFKIYLDILKCKIKYKATLYDYGLFEMYKMDKFERKTILTKGKNEDLCKKYNNPKYKQEINNKQLFFKKFSNYLNRDWLEINGQNEKDFENFWKKHKSIVINHSKEEKELKNSDTRSVYLNVLMEQNKIVEELVENCPTLKNINSDLKTNLKVVTLLGSVAIAYLEIGNFEHNGFIAPINIETGLIEGNAIDRDKNIIETTSTNQELIGLKIPKWKDVIELVELASLEIPAIGYVEWTIQIGTKKCYLMNATSIPHYYCYQLPNTGNSNVGLLPLYKQIEERKIGK